MRRAARTTYFRAFETLLPPLGGRSGFVYVTSSQSRAAASLEAPWVAAGLLDEDRMIADATGNPPIAVTTMMLAVYL
jgi:hypothetical protein